jgi:protein-S-isoprenylcysteine O-methyltransferase Ste14
MEKQDTPGVIAPPPLIYLVAVVIGLVLRYLAPAAFLLRGLDYTLGAVLIVIAVGFSLWGVRVMRLAGTSAKPTVPTTALVTTGPFRFSRNPLYVSLTLFYLGIAIVAQSLWAIALLFVVLAVMSMGETTNEPFQLSFNTALKVRIPGIASYLRRRPDPRARAGRAVGLQ